MVCTPQHKTLNNARACNKLDINMKNKHYTIILNPYINFIKNYKNPFSSTIFQHLNKTNKSMK